MTVDTLPLDTRVRPLEAVFFDLDGTLMDTAPDFIVVVNSLRARCHLKPLPAEMIRQYVSAGALALVLKSLGIHPNSPDAALWRQRLIDAYQELVNNYERPQPAQIYKGLDRVLRTLETRHIPWGVVTNKPKDLAKPLIAQSGLSDICQTLVCPEDVTHSKPDPESLLLACRQVGCSTESALYIGDHSRDIEAGRRAGMKTMAALYGYIPEGENPSIWEADYYLNSSDDLLGWFEHQQWLL
ncbi:Phosphoglycolate phosphatase, chromosomal [invertebrate metagenome]|uniref:Phosphoglycolate phosphatase, chromosomal n=1 Tax=invertebrate metagenome TaxID=1711999 RepID=A0A2H9TAP4_9ZZZZ